MRYAIIHCRQCAQHIWVPESKLGTRGRCPECGAPIQAPDHVPPEELVKGPLIMQDLAASEAELAVARS
jgi:uncharacterized paraquat-inducible protein A